jgi:hypothetical protein
MWLLERLTTESDKEHMKIPTILLTTCALIFLLSSCNEKRETFHDLIKIEDNGMYGFANAAGVRVITPMFEEIDIFSDKLASVRVGSKWGIVDLQARQVWIPQFENKPICQEERALVHVGNKWGFLNSKGKLVIKLIYDEARDYRGGIAWVRDSLWGVIDVRGKYVQVPQFSRSIDADEYFAGLAWIERNGKFGLIDSCGHIVADPAYDEIGSSMLLGSPRLRGSLTAVRSGALWGYVDSTGKQIIACQYQAVSREFTEGLARVKLNDRWGFIDKTGELLRVPEYDSVKNFWQGFAPVCISGKWGYVDRKGEMTIPVHYDSVDGFHEGRAAVAMKGKYGFIDTLGNWVALPKYTSVGFFSEGRACVLQGNWLDGKWGFINTAGTMVIKPQFEFKAYFGEGLADVELRKARHSYLWDTKSGYIDTTGYFVIPPRYNFTGPFVLGYAVVGLGEDPRAVFEVIDKKGNAVGGTYESMNRAYDTLWKMVNDSIKRRDQPPSEIR